MVMFQNIQRDSVARPYLIDEARQVFNEVIDFPLPLIAAVNGPAVGLGCTLAVLCDLVYVAESAYLADPHVGVGLTAGDGGAPFWPLTMSIVKAKELLFFGTKISASDAVELGLANATKPDDEVLISPSRRRSVGETAFPSAAVDQAAVNLHIRRGPPPCSITPWQLNINHSTPLSTGPSSRSSSLPDRLVDRTLFPNVRCHSPVRPAPMTSLALIRPLWRL